MHNLFFVLGLLIIVVIIVYFSWSCCFKDHDDEATGASPGLQFSEGQSYPVTPVFARELESGLVVLQSQDGGFFRILQEYDSAKQTKSNTSYGACAEIMATQTASTTQYVPHYTRAHYQNAPTAPPMSSVSGSLIDLHVVQPPSQSNVPPPYSQY